MEAARLLLKYGANPNAESTVYWQDSKCIMDIYKQYVARTHAIHFPPGTTPLFIAMSERNFELASLLLEKGANWNREDKLRILAPIGKSLELHLLLACT